jgi:hypothetical protein
MTVSVRPAVSATSFDWAVFAAVACGWPPPAAFTAVCVMKSSGMTEAAIEQAFVDAKKRVQ